MKYPFVLVVVNECEAGPLTFAVPFPPLNDAPMFKLFVILLHPCRAGEGAGRAVLGDRPVMGLALAYTHNHLLTRSSLAVSAIDQSFEIFL